ncbi:TrbI/VirB10 family protein [Xanthomonas euvesicatoria]|uniref:TrbI/VirB10 family protein n=1 Tax=Xanthomonas euvesicatoria TaxID=456327 RepID=UPI0002E7F228|nr:TrbI/VirB10 family protein [Xanthomonas euvesicatoria]PPU86540.1 secretion protein [Xanthomonas euvesicatoria pv. citrumelonis]
MSQNNPPENNEGRPDLGDGDHARSSNSVQDPSNPYFARTQAQPLPNLDASAPELRSVEDQRLNRKALFFLGAIVLVLLVLAFFLYKSATNRNSAEPKKEQTAAVTAPSLPKLANNPGPVDVQQDVPPISLAPPPLPPPETPGYPQPVYPASTRTAGPTLAERRMASAGGATESGGAGPATAEEYSNSILAGLNPAGGGAAAGSEDVNEADKQKVTNAQFIRHPDALLVRGTYLRCILETRVITDIPGFTSCLITEPVYSINGRTLLLPKGSKIYGSYSGGPTGQRVSVIWDRITTPTGVDVSMSSPGIDGLGGAGHPGQYDAHWGQRLSSALMISLLADAFKYAAAEYGPEQTTVSQTGVEVQSPYESATARTMERIANDAATESMRRPATVTINQGSLINVYVAKDVDFTNVLPRR